MPAVQEFPKWKYHAVLPPRIVNDPEQETNLGHGWADHPDLVPKVAEPGQPAAEPEAETEEQKPNGKPNRRSR